MAVIETETVYYLHHNLCSEVGGGEHGVEAWHNLTLTPSLTSVTLGWRLDKTETKTVKLSVRRFGEDDSVFSQLVTHDGDDDTAYYTVSGLAEDTGYTGEDNDDRTLLSLIAMFSVCIDTMESDQDNSGECKEFRTLSSSLTAGEQVAAATAVSSSSTAVIVALVCCCCFSRKKKRKEEAREKGLLTSYMQGI